MTICLALRVEDKDGIHVFIGADSAVSTDETKVKHLANIKKFVKLKNYYILCAGAGTISETLEELKNNNEFIKKLRITNCLEAKAFAQTVFSMMKEDLENSIISDKDEFHKHFSELLIATPKSIFCVYQDLSAYEFESFAAVGSGSNFALGSLSTSLRLHSKELQPNLSIPPALLEAIVVDAVWAACEHSLFCSPPIMVRKVS